MPLDPRFVEAFIHQPRHVILGRRLRPFCLWHRTLLQSISSPVLERDRQITFRDLDRAVSICQCKYGEVDFSFRHPVRLFWRFAAGGVQRASAEFVAYMADYLGAPAYKHVLTRAQEESGPPLPVGRPPTDFSIAAAIIGWAHCPIAQVWKMPIGEAQWYAAAAQEAAGARLDFEQEEDREFLEALKRSENDRATK